MVDESHSKDEFDKIAVLSERDGEFGSVYDRFLSSCIPNDCARAVEVGCGNGSFTRILAKRASYVEAIDISPEMIRIAAQRSGDFRNIEYSVADILTVHLATACFDCIVIIGTLHHLPLHILAKLKRALSVDGLLIIHDPLKPEGLIDVITNVVRFPIQVVSRWLRTGRPWPRANVRKAWAQHAKNDHYLTRRDVKTMRDHYLPDGNIQYHFLWRYTVTWRKKRSPVSCSFPNG
jgi:SAM-dependent methyltransferase